MNPALAMGTFIRVWRERWAKLTREQLAQALPATCALGRPVAAHVVYAWERGQPSRTAAELDALLQVMHRRGLHEAELTDVRRTAMATCAARQYPELFPDEAFASREDVDQVA